MSTKALKSQLLAAVAMVLVASIALGSSTFAWFAVNSKVTATGMEVTTKVSNNLLIAASTLATTAKEDDSNFKTAMDKSILNGLLEPVSTVNGVSYFYNSTKNVQATGDAIGDTYVAYNAANTTAFNTNYETTGAVGYVDYVFQLKAINSGNADAYVNMTNLNLVYGGTDSTEKAFRTAMFVWDMGEDGSTAADADVNASNLVTILAPAGSAEFSDGKAVSAADAAPTAITNADEAANIGTVGAGKTKFYKVVVRLWLEGEDTTCNNATFASLKDKWALNLAIQLQDTTGGVTAINRTATTGKTDLSGAGVTVSTDAADIVKIDGVTYNLVSVTMGADKLYTKDTTLSSTSVIYKLDGGLYPIDVTNQCILP